MVAGDAGRSLGRRRRARVRAVRDYARWPIGVPERALQEAGFVSYWHHGTVKADKDGCDFEEHGETSYSDDYWTTHVECGDCLHVVYVLDPDPHDSSAPGLRQHVTAALRALREHQERSVSELTLEHVCDAWDAFCEEVEGSR